MEERLELKGEIEDIIYQNEVNGYLIANLETKQGEITIVGYIPFVNVGETLRVTGNYVEHKEYGLQFKVETFEKLMPETLSALEKYLAKGNVKGIGKAMAKKIIKAFGEETIHILKFEPHKLATIKGISEEKAKEMSESFVENWEVWQIVGFLERFGIGAENAKKVFNLFGVNAIEKIEENPYLLVDITSGINFKQIDKMAMDLGISFDNDKRVKSCIKYSLLQIAVNGNCCVIKQNLIQFVKQMIGVEEETIENNIINLNVDNQIYIEKRDDDVEWVYLYYFNKVENQIAQRIIGLKNYKNIKRVNKIEKEIEKVEKMQKITLSEKQKEAIQEINENNVTIITGGPGTGKTTIIKSIIDIYKSKGYKMVLCAPTGRAAKRMTETTGEKACTLHRLLEIGKIDEDSLYTNNEDYEGTPIDGDVIIVDELSMVDMFLMNFLLNCIYKGTKLVLVGDCDQLPSVGPGSVLKDLINSEKLKTVHLDKIFRQAAKSKIILNAHRVNNGLDFVKKGDEELSEDTNEDFFFISETSQENMLKQVISLCTGRLQNFGNYDFFQNMQVLTPTKKGILGTKELNKSLQQFLNPHQEGKEEKENITVTYRVGDRIMQVKNNYDIYWEKEAEKNENGSGVFNGEMGTILKIDNKDKVMKIKFDDEKICWYDFKDLEQIEHSYCITIHKAQRK